MTTPNLHDDPKRRGGPTLSGIIAGRYRIEREIGDGGMATVYLARDLTHDVNVALKAPKPELVAQLSAARFTREIQISIRLQHPRIVPVLDSGVTANGVPFYVMPFVEGETLEQRLARSGPLPVDDVISIASDVLEGLGYAHAQGFVHRDVKPPNVMLTNGRALLADFGLARTIDTTNTHQLTLTGFALGTAEYMSPEQAAGEAQMDGRSDLYSFGCVLYEMLTGTPPFTAPTTRAVMTRHFVDPVPDIRTLRSDVPTTLAAAVTQALSKAPSARFPDAAAFRAALVDLPRREVIPQRGLAGTTSRRRLWLTVGVATVLLACAAVLWSMWGVQ